MDIPVVATFVADIAPVVVKAPLGDPPTSPTTTVPVRILLVYVIAFVFNNEVEVSSVSSLYFIVLLSGIGSLIGYAIPS